MTRTESPGRVTSRGSLRSSVVSLPAVLTSPGFDHTAAPFIPTPQHRATRLPNRFAHSLRSFTHPLEDSLRSRVAPHPVLFEVSLRSTSHRSSSKPSFTPFTKTARGRRPLEPCERALRAREQTSHGFVAARRPRQRAPPHTITRFQRSGRLRPIPLLPPAPARAPPSPDVATGGGTASRRARRGRSRC